MTPEEAREVLGVAEGAAEAEVRRAYLAGVKAHKPETDPEGFTRVRAAFELLSRLTAPSAGAPKPEIGAGATQNAGPEIRPSAPAGFDSSHLDLSDLDRTTALLLEAIRSGVAVDDQACLDLAGALADEGRNDELAHVLRAGFSLGSLRCLAWLAADLPERLTVEELLVAARIEHDAVLAGLLRVLPERRLHDLGALVLTQRLGTAAPTDDVPSLIALATRFLLVCTGDGRRDAANAVNLALFHFIERVDGAIVVTRDPQLSRAYSYARELLQVAPRLPAPVTHEIARSVIQGDPDSAEEGLRTFAKEAPDAAARAAGVLERTPLALFGDSLWSGPKGDLGERVAKLLSHPNAVMPLVVLLLVVPGVIAVLAKDPAPAPPPAMSPASTLLPHPLDPSPYPDGEWPSPVERRAALTEATWKLVVGIHDETESRRLMNTAARFEQGCGPAGAHVQLVRERLQAFAHDAKAAEGVAVLERLLDTGCNPGGRPR